MPRAYELAAMRLGLAEQIANRIGYADKTPMHPLINAALATVQAALEPAAFAEAFAAGQAMSLAEAFAMILSADATSQSPFEAGKPVPSTGLPLYPA